MHITRPKTDECNIEPEFAPLLIASVGLKFKLDFRDYLYSLPPFPPREAWGREKLIKAAGNRKD